MLSATVTAVEFKRNIKWFFEGATLKKVKNSNSFRVIVAMRPNPILNYIGDWSLWKYFRVFPLHFQIFKWNFPIRTVRSFIVFKPQQSSVYVQPYTPSSEPPHINRSKSVQPNITWILCLREWRRTKVLNCVYIFLSYSWMFNKGMKIHFTFSHFPNFPHFFFLTSVVKLFWFFFRYTPDLICSFRRLVSSLFVSTSVHSVRM